MRRRRLLLGELCLLIFVEFHVGCTDYLEFDMSL